MLGFTWTCVSREDGVHIDHLASSTVSFCKSISSDILSSFDQSYHLSHTCFPYNQNTLLAGYSLLSWLGWGTILLEQYSTAPIQATCTTCTAFLRTSWSLYFLTTWRIFYTDKTSINHVYLVFIPCKSYHFTSESILILLGWFLS